MHANWHDILPYQVVPAAGHHQGGTSDCRENSRVESTAFGLFGSNDGSRAFPWRRPYPKGGTVTKSEVDTTFPMKLVHPG